MKQKLLTTLLFLWAGMLIGLSFIATPIKFTAPHLSMAHALEVGKVTFNLFNRVEIGIFVACILLAIFSSRKIALWLGAVAILLLVQTFYLIPQLNIRVDYFIANGANIDSYKHIAYIILEAIKLLILIYIANISIRIGKSYT